MQAAGNISSRYQCAVLVKGGHQLNDANDLLCRDEHCRWFYGKRIDNPNTHGTGCTLSSAIAANLAKGFDMEESVRRAKDYLSGAGSHARPGERKRATGPCLCHYRRVSERIHGLWKYGREYMNGKRRDSTRKYSA